MVTRRLPFWVQSLAACSLVVLAGCTQQKAERPKVTIESEPESGAQVIIQGVDYGATPVSIQGLHPGPTALELHKEGFKPAIELVNVPMDQDLALVIQLKPLVGFLTIESEPQAARVFLDGAEFIGETPLFRVPVSVGEHELMLSKENYEPLRKTINVQEDYLYEERHQLTPVKSSLAIITIPTGANIWINEAFQEQRTPARIELPPGIHSVSVHAKGFMSKDESVTLGPAEQKTLDLRLIPGNVPPNMVLVPAGEFVMGSDQSPHERPQRTVFLDTFYIDKFEVTNQQYKMVFAGHEFKENEELLPVRGVTWNQANEYASAVGKRLPTESEWEKAARGAEGRVYPWGNDFTAEWCNSAETFAAVPRKVGLFREGQSPYGCMDMAGNVYEWTADWYKAYEGNAEISRDYGQLFRVLRGGSFKVKRFDLRCPARHYDKQEAKREDYGFRCAKDAE